MQNFDHRHLLFAILAPFSYRIRLDTVSKVKVKVIARPGNFLVVYRRQWLWSHQRVLTFKHLKVFISDSSVCNFRPNLRIYKRQKTDAIHPCPILSHRYQDTNQHVPVEYGACISLSVD